MKMGRLKISLANGAMCTIGGEVKSLREQYDTLIAKLNSEDIKDCSFEVLGLVDIGEFPFMALPAKSAWVKLGAVMSVSLEG